MQANNTCICNGEIGTFLHYTLLLNDLLHVASLVTAVVKGYAPVKFISVAVWELVGALLTGLTLIIEQDSEE